MCRDICEYVADKNKPDTWHGDGTYQWRLDHSEEEGGLGITEWRCPHPSLDGRDRCVFHTEPEELPDDINESKQLLDAINEAGKSPFDDGPEHRGQFVGAIFGALDLSEEEIAATEEYDVRFDYAVFCGDEEGLDFEKTRFVTSGARRLSFYRTTFKTLGNSDMDFSDATFGTEGTGNVIFKRVTFEAAGDSTIDFSGAAFGTEDDGEVMFKKATFKTVGTGSVNFSDTTFRTDGTGNVCFLKTRFRAAKTGNVIFTRATFETAGNGEILFSGAVFETTDAGDMIFLNATFETAGNGGVDYSGATFNVAGNHTMNFTQTTFKTTACGNVSFSGVTFETDGNRAMDFSLTTFETTSGGSVDFGDTTFKTKGNLEFVNSTFRTSGDGDVVFKNSTFENESTQRVNFSQAAFVTDGYGDVDFGDTIFETEGNVSFDTAAFKTNDDGNVGFECATFETTGNGYVGFHGATFKTVDDGNLDFGGATFRTATDGNVTFEGATFVTDGDGTVLFRDVDFIARTDFSDVVIAPLAMVSFRGSEFHGEFIFGATQGVPYIRGRLDFTRVSFLIMPNFLGGRQLIEYEIDELTEHRLFDAVFVDSVDFSDVHFPDDFDFNNFRFSAESSFEGANLSGVNFSGADLSGVSFERAQLNRAELLGANLQGAHLYGALLGDARINRDTQFWPQVEMKLRDVRDVGDTRVGGGYWRRLKTVLRGNRIPYCAEDSRYDDLEIEGVPPQRETDLEKAAEVYTTIEQIARANSLPRLASEAFLGRKDVQYREYCQEGRLAMQLRSFVPNLVSRYGESPWRVLLAGAVIVSVCGVTYRALGLIESVSNASNPSLWDSIYFSALTFTTLGYGDFRPANGLGQLLAVSETALGVILLAILVFVFGRRATR